MDNVKIVKPNETVFHQRNQLTYKTIAITIGTFAMTMAITAMTMGTFAIFMGNIAMTMKNIGNLLPKPLMSLQINPTIQPSCLSLLSK